MSMNCKMQLVLNFCKKCFGSGCLFIIINTCGVYISQFLIKPTFTEPNLSDFGKQMFIIIFTKKSAVLQTFFIYYVTTKAILFGLRSALQCFYHLSAV